MGRPMMPSPMNPTFMPKTPCASAALSGLALAVGGEPGGEPGRGGGRGLVLAADPAGVALPVERGEDEGVVDLARAGLVAPGVVGDLDVGDPVLQPPEGVDEIALHDLRVVEVVLEVEVVRADLVHDLGRLRRPVEIEARDVAGVDRLDQEPDPGLR